MPHADRRRRDLPTARPAARARARARARAVPVTGALLGAVLLLAGCASMPDNGDVSRVGQGPRDASDPQVRVFGVQPQANEGPKQIVEGFLEAVTSDEANFQTARDYLSPSAARTWNPFKAITVVSGSKPDLETLQTGADRNSLSSVVNMTTGQVAVVGADNSYAPADRQFRTTFHLDKYKGQWRIDGQVPGLIIEESDFQRIYQSVDMYYFAQLGSDPGSTAGGAPSAADTMVADPMYVRRRINPISASIDALLSGPSSWLKPVASTAFPRGAKLVGPEPSPDDKDVLRVRLSGLPQRLSGETCRRMAAQLTNTVANVTSDQLAAVEIDRSGAGAVCTLDRGDAQEYSPARLSGSSDQQYFVDADHRLESVPSSGDESQHVPGPLGAASAGLSTAAVSRDGSTAAGVRTDGRSLVVAPLGNGPEVHVLTSRTGLGAPSWDRLGDLWVADHDPSAPALRLWRDGKLTTVRMPESGGDRVESVRVAADGVRVLLLVRHDGHTVLEIGRVERSGPPSAPVVSVAGLRVVAPGFEDVQAVSWAGESRLVMVGKPWKGVQELQYIDTDGSDGFVPTLPGISMVTAVAASEDQSRPLLVADTEGVYRLPTDSSWTQLSENSTSPVYPG